MLLQTDRAAWQGAQPIRHSLFFAALLDVEAQDRVGDFTDAYRRHHGLKGTPRPRRTLHVSLFSIARRISRPPPPGIVSLARDIGGRIAQSPFKAQFNQVEGWTRPAGPWPTVLVGDEGVVGFERLHEALALAHGGRPDAHFRPHVSLMWGQDRLAADPVRPLAFTVRAFALVHSHVGASRYDVKSRFPLVHG